MIRIHSNARTTRATRPETVRRWRKRSATDCPDRSARPRQPSWKASEEERAIVCSLQPYPRVGQQRHGRALNGRLSSEVLGINV